MTVHHLIRTLTVGLAAVAVSTLAWAEQPLAPKIPEEQKQEKPGLAAPDLNANPVLIEAAKLAPVPPETLARHVPDKLLRCSRTSLDKHVRQFGPAMTSEIEASFECSASGQRIDLALVDPAGIRASTGFLPVPEPGETIDHGGRAVTRAEVNGFAAAMEEGGSGLPSVLQVLVGPRLRLTLTGTGIDSGDLREAARSLDLAAWSALASVAPPSGAAR